MSFYSTDKISRPATSLSFSDDEAPELLEQAIVILIEAKEALCGVSLVSRVDAIVARINGFLEKLK